MTKGEFMNKIDRFLIATMFIFLFICVGINNYQINKISGVYFDQSIIESIAALNYIPTELIEANVIVATKQSSGSGSIIKVDKNKTYILTAAHVIYGEKIVRNDKDKLERQGKLSRNITITSNGKKYKALTVKIDRDLDLAVLKIYKKLNVKPVKISKEEPKLGDVVWTVGNPGGLTNVVNSGVFSTVDKEQGHAFVSTAGFFGSSGGMVVNTKGEQFGVISTVAIAKVKGYFPSITIYNGITRTKDLNKFLKGVL